MARTQAVDFDQRREKITEAAAVLIAKKGFLGASVADISASCNMSKSLIYHYFPAKEDILFEVMWAHVSKLLHLANTVTVYDRTPDDQLIWLARVLMEAYNGAQAQQKILLNEMDNLPAEKRGVIVQAQRDLMAVVDKFVALKSYKLRSQPKLRPPYVMMFFGMLNWTHTWFDRAGPVSETKVADIASDMFLKGLPF
jgi:AcrR family transcriptional regulator